MPHDKFIKSILTFMLFSIICGCLEDMPKAWRYRLQIKFSQLISYFQWISTVVDDKDLKHLGNGLVLQGIKSLPQPMLSKCTKPFDITRNQWVQQASSMQWSFFTSQFQSPYNMVNLLHITVNGYHIAHLWPVLLRKLTQILLNPDEFHCQFS